MIDNHITDRNTIIESELKYKNLVENQGEGVIIGNMDEDLLFANPAASRIMGVPAEELVNKNLKDFIDEHEIKKVQEQTKTRGKGISSTYELVIKRPDEQRREVMITATPLFDHTKKVIGSIGIFRDITEWNQAKHELEKNRHMLNLINKILRHDLTNYLVAIQSGLNLYSREHNREFLDETYKKIASSIDLIRKMKEFESINYSDKELNAINTEDILKRIRLLYPEIKLESRGKCDILANESIHSVFNNIITNAISHGKTDKIIVEVEKEGDYCIIRIRDFGIGIPDKLKARIFEEGFKAGKTGKSGLGLYIVKEALHIIGATIEVRDNQPQGTTFIIRIAAYDPKPNA
jgi:PAS domain S-box-containing protein